MKKPNNKENDQYNRSWLPIEIDVLLGLNAMHMSQASIAKILNRTNGSIRYRLYELKRDEKDTPKRFIQESAFVSCGEPLNVTGDALVISDTEFPYQHADFMNRCIELALAWGIKNCIVGGDFVHFGNLSRFPPSFAPDRLGLYPSDFESIRDEISDFVLHMKNGSNRERGIEILDKIDEITCGIENREDLSIELQETRKGAAELESAFENLFIVLGNHDNRLARTLPSAGVEISELKTLLKLQEKTTMTPFFFCTLESGSEEFLIEHPVNTAKYSARRLASKFQKHVLMGHNHQYSDSFDPSGTYWAIEIGCSSDENKMPYAAMRHNASDQHSLGAVIVRDGYPYHLNVLTQWERMKKIV